LLERVQGFSSQPRLAAHLELLGLDRDMKFPDESPVARRSTRLAAEFDGAADLGPSTISGNVGWMHLCKGG
jgi:hypothetical protein